MIEYTDQQFLYKAVPVDYDGAAKLKRIKGNTLAFNQLVNNGNFASTSGWQNNSWDSFTVSGNVGKIVATGVNRGTYAMVDLIPGHKYLLMAEVNSSQPMNVGINELGGRTQTTVTNQYITVSKVATASAGGSKAFALYSNSSSQNTMNVRNCMLIDLTLLNASYITDYNSFMSYFPLSYYSYQSTLLPFKGTSIKTVGKNLIKFPPFDYTFPRNGIEATISGSELTVKGTATGNTGFYDASHSNSYEECQLGPFLAGTYKLQMQGFKFVANGTRIVYTAFKKDGTRIANGASVSDGNVRTLVSDQEFKIALWGQVASGDTVDNKVTIMLTSESDVSYEPYTSSTTDLPTLTYFPTGMKSAGDVYDELLPNKAITRVGMVDLGSLNWTYDSSVPRFTSSDIVSAVAVPSSNSNIANIKCAVYDSISLNGLAQSNKCIAVSTGGVISAKDTAYTSASTFKSSLSGVYLYYELKNYVETDADAEIIYRFYQYGTEQILPVNGTTPTTAPIWCDIEYYTQIEGETPYRKFWLVNGNGERWDLTEKELKSFLENPQGLGFQKTIDVTRYGERAYKNTESYNFPQVTGDVLFYDSANSTRYEKYNEFVRFLMEQPITLHYMIPVSYNSLIADTYSLECEVMSLTKTESKTDRILTSNIQMNGLGFYEGDEIEINGTANTLTINNKGDFPVGFEIELRGTYKNPYFTLEQNGELYGEAKFDDNANNFSSVFVNSKDGEQNVVLKQNNSIMPNPLAYQDLSISNGSIYVTFVKLAKGESTLTIGGDSYTISGYTIRYTPIYRSV